MDRESYLRSLPYLHPSLWPTPSSARSHGGSYVRKLIFPRHVVSIEPLSSEDGDTLGPAFFQVAATNYDECDTTDDETEVGEYDPALCNFEASVLVPKSVAGVSPGASSATLSQSPNTSTPAARKPAVSSRIPPPNGLADAAKPGSEPISSPEPILYFRFGGNGTYCVDYSRILSISLEPGNNATSNEGGLGGNDQSQRSRTTDGDGDGTNKYGRLVPSSVVISFDTCSFRIFQLGSDEEDKGDKEQLNCLRLVVNELTASLRAAGSFIAPSSPSTDKDSGDTQSSGRASLEEGGQCGIGLAPSSSGSEVRGHSQPKDADCETNITRFSEDGREECQPSQPSLAPTDTSCKAFGMSCGLPSNSEEAKQSKRRRTEYDQSVAAIENIVSIADPLYSLSSPQSRPLGSGPLVEKHMSSLMTAAASSLSASYMVGSDEAYTTGEVERVLTDFDGVIVDFFPVHTRIKHLRGDSLLSSPPGQRALEATDEPARESEELRNSARQLMKEYRHAIIARHKAAILPNR